MSARRNLVLACVVVGAAASCNVVLGIDELPSPVDAELAGGHDATVGDDVAIGDDAAADGPADPDAIASRDASMDDVLDSGSADGGTPCGSGFADCDGSCVDITTNGNCGGCGIVCPSAAFCAGASCACSAGESLCDAGCLDDQIDIHNCGGCGTECAADVDAGETPVCVAGYCRRTVVLTSAVDNPAGIAVTGSTVVWANMPNGSGTIESNPDDGWDALHRGVGHFAALRGRDARGAVYWTGFGDETVDTAPLTGGPVNVLQTGQQLPVGIAVDSTRVYWADFSAGQIASSSLDGGAPTPLVSGLGGPSALAIDATNLYFTDNVSGAVGWLPKTGGPTTTVRQDGGAQPSAVTVAGGKVYWTNGAVSESVLTAAVDAGVPTTLASTRSAPRAW